MDEQFKLDPEDFEGYGTEMEDMVKMVNTQAEEINRLKGETSMVAQRQVESAEDTYYEALDNAVSDWRVINKDPRFIQWLTGLDEFSGRPRQELLDEPESDDDLYRIHYAHGVDNVLREHQTVHNVLSNATKTGLIGYLSSQALICFAWGWKYLFGLTETGYGLWWNNLYHLISLPSLFAMGAGRFYEGTLRSERPFNYDPLLEWDSQRIVHEAILLKGIEQISFRIASQHCGVPSASALNFRSLVPPSIYWLVIKNISQPFFTRCRT